MTADSSRTVCTFGPSRPLTLVIAAAAVLSGADALASSNPAGRIMLGCVAVVLATIAASDFIFAPRLRADPLGLAIRSVPLRVRLAWSEIDVIRVDDNTHLGLSSRALEIEAGEILAVFGKRGLGCDPRLAFDQLYECAGNAPAGVADRLLHQAGHESLTGPLEQALEDDRAPDDGDEQHGGDPAEAR